MDKLPVLFIGHGSPMNMILDNAFTRSMAALGKALPRPQAIMVISAHWLTEGSFVACVKEPELIYDFFGFPKELYKIKYGCKGAPDHARMAADLTCAKGRIVCDRDRGLDHAAYAILKYIFPKADIPVFEMSIDYSFNGWQVLPVEYHYELARNLAKLRRSGVLIIGSGNMVHNLARIDYEADAEPYPWAVEIDRNFRSKLLEGDHKYFIDYPAKEKDASWAAPTLDHYLPMIYVLALQEKGETLKFEYEGIQNASISMRSFRIE